MKSKKCKFLTFIKFTAVIFLAFIVSLSQPWPVLASVDPLQTSASSGLLMDAETGRVLWEKEPNIKRSVASTTKMMTGIVTIENASFDEIITISSLAADVGEAEIYLSPGEKRSVEDLLYGVLLKSGNDAAAALAEHVGGSVEDFVKMMNEKANKLGTKNTHFMNPTGLEQDGHYSSAYDLALIARYCLQNEKFAEIVSTEKHTIPWPDNPYPRVLTNHNKLVLEYDYIKGVKTGYTKKAGYCLVALATKDGKKVISVVLNAPTSEDCYTDSKKILDYGLNEFEMRKIVRKGESVELIPLIVWKDRLNLVADKDFYLLTKKEHPELIKIISVKYPKLPVSKGQKIGEIQIFDEQQELGKVSLLADKNIFKSGFLEQFLDHIQSFFEILWKK
ncbi:D-alanyl-D-alanine carboxypeptidase family protein [Candidatus Oleimmundimicrobium sp.]|uniref:D-alanyl-D-alanine carboxypeptidase family protein n=1 Tax=Candidatus Oleimmundimicrobium sp. TaxID=3060597 RepID=UPI0027192AEE|nr:D-alanyl-D-alanine carboxypeptidase family protein [Candidatus Oleimmundimicrobium sp.]MDO8885321.1 D-alanyl-D-alanine carboxypeptidase family protein [Candidatus Oleimmundimicrobium sp.]